MTDLITCLCCNCKRLVPLNELTIFEGRDYHSSCYLKTVRTRISEIDKKIQRGTATMLDAKELQELTEIERSVKSDIENATPDYGYSSDDPLFFGNTPLGLQSAINPPGWKRILRETGTLAGTKYHFHKKQPVIPSTTEPIFKIITDEHGHKSCIQISSKHIQTVIQIEGKTKPTLPLETKTHLLEFSEKKYINMNGAPSPTGLPLKINDSLDTKIDNTQAS